MNRRPWHRCAVVLCAFLVVGAVVAPARAQTLTFVREADAAPDTPGTRQENPSILAAPTGAVYLAWDEAVDGVREIFVTRATGPGQPFDVAVQVTDGDADQTHPALAWAPGGLVVLAWADATGGDTDIVAVKSDGAWPAFTTPVQVSDGPGSSSQTLPALVVDGSGTVHVAWEDLRADRDIRAASAPVSSLAFGASVRVDDDPGNAWQHEPSLAAGDGILYVAWWDRREIDPRIYVATSSDGGAAFGANVRVTGTGGPEFEPDIAVHNGRLYAVWQDGRSGVGRDIYVARASPSTLDFGSAVQVNGGAGSSNQRSPSLAIAGDGAVSVVWEDFRDAVFEVYHAVSRDGGIAFAEGRVHQERGETNLDKPGPVVAVTGDGTVWVAWEDQRPGDTRIAFAYSGPVEEVQGDLILPLFLLLLAVGVVIAWLLVRRKRRRERSE